MPYASIDELPEGVRNALPTKAQKIFMEAYNAGDSPDEMEEERAMRRAWGAVKAAGWAKGDDGKWMKRETSQKRREARVAKRAALQRLLLDAEIRKAKG